MRLCRYLCILALAVLCAGVAVPASGQSAPTIGIAGDHFTVDRNTGEGPQARFLMFVSYFDGMRATNLGADLDFIRAAGFDGIRIFPNWWKYARSADGTDICNTSGDDTLLDANGNVRGADQGTSASTPLGKFRAVLDAAASRGLLVDVSFSRETVPGDLSVAHYQSGIVTVAQLLGGSYPNVLFDLQNERDQGTDGQRLSASEIRGIVHAVQAVPGWSSRVIVASNSSASTVAETRDLALPDQGDLPAVAYHDTRDKVDNAYVWHTRVRDTVLGLRASGKPVYLQEPIPWNAGLSVCGKIEPDPKEADGDAAHFREAVKQAKLAGAAAWTFHTRQSFRLSDGTFENKVNAVSGERELLLGTSSLKQTADNNSWALADQRLSVSLGGTGQGGVVSSPAGISCQTTPPAGTCEQSFAYNSEVTLTAQATNGSTFAGWSGDCTTSTISGDGLSGSCAAWLNGARSVVAQFTFTPTDTVLFYHTDAVGSVRLITDKNGATSERLDYLPFGEEWPNATTSEARKFVSSERDTETGFDYLGARYYRSLTGRFTTVDPGHVNGDLFDPQSWNGYAYARNNPMKYADPTGTEYEICAYGASGSSGSCGTVSDQYFAILQRSPGAGIQLSGGAIFAGNKIVGYYNQTSVDPTFNDFVRLTGALSSQWLQEQSTQMAVGAVIAATGGLAGGVFSGGLAIDSSLSIARGVSSNTLNHIFGKAAHNLGPLVARFGSQEAAFSAVQRATQAAVRARGITGIFETTVRVGSQSVVVRGNVINGLVRIGTFFIP